MPLSKDTPISKWISDFVKSDHPKFAGKSPEQRRKMAIGAYYSKQRSDESYVEELDTIEDDLLEPIEITEAPIELSNAGVSATHIKHIINHFGKENIHSIRPVANKSGHYSVFLKDKKNPALLNTRSVKVHDRDGVTHTNVASPTTVSAVKNQRYINSSIDYENYNIVLEYRIRNSHAEDMTAAMEAGKRAKAEGNDLDVHIHHAHDDNGNAVGVWNNLKDEGRYIKVTHQRGRNEKMTTESLNEEDIHGKTVLRMKKYWGGELRKSPYIVVKKGTAIPHRESEGHLKEVPTNSDNISFHSKDEAEKIASKGENHEAIHHEEFLKRKGIDKDMYESEENIDEISQSTLMSYGKKAGSEKANAEKLSKDPNAGSRMQNAASEILKKRRAGLDRLEKRAEKVNVTEETEKSEEVEVTEPSKFANIAKEVVEKHLNTAKE